MNANANANANAYNENNRIPDSVLYESIFYLSEGRVQELELEIELPLPTETSQLVKITTTIKA